MPELNISYLPGQIKPEYRGDDIMFLQAHDGGMLSLNRRPLTIPGSTVTLTKDIEFAPIRTYIGVNDKAESKLREVVRTSGLSSAFDLDRYVVGRSFVDSTLKAVTELSEARLRQAIAMEQ